MKNVKKAAAATLALILVLMAGCSGAADYPVIEAVDTTNMTLASAQDDSVKVSYPADDWTVQEGVSPLTLMYSDAMGTGSECNINVQASQECNSKLTQKDLEDLVDSIKEYAGYIAVDFAELRLLNGEPVIYWESTIQFTEEYLDLMIEMGGFSEEDIETLGGREALLSIPATKQIMLYAVVNGYLFTYVGTYYDDAQKQAVIDTLTVLVPNTEKI